MNEAETRAELIDPALREAGWGVVEDSRVRREMICPGRIEGAGRRGKPEIADYVLTYRNHKLAVIEAKARDKPDTEGVGQAKDYAEKLQARFAYSTNGRRIYQIDMETGAEGYVERYPTPRRTLGREPSRSRTHGATASPPCPSRTEAAPGRRAITSTTPSRTRWKRSRRQAAHPADARHRHRQNRDRLPDRLEAVPEPLEPVSASRRGGRASCFSPTATFWPIRPTTPSRRFPKTRWCASSPTRSARRAACRRTRSIFFTIFQTFMSGTGADGKPAPVFRRLSAGLLRLHHHRRVPSRRRQRRKQLARHSRIFRARRAARPDRHAQAPRQRRHLRLFRRAGLHLLAERGHQ